MKQYYCALKQYETSQIKFKLNDFYCIGEKIIMIICMQLANF